MVPEQTMLDRFLIVTPIKITPDTNATILQKPTAFITDLLSSCEHRVTMTSDLISSCR